MLNIRGDEYVCTNEDCADVQRIPDSEKPWRKCGQCGNQMRKRMSRFRYRHEDNPRWYDHETVEWTEECVFYVGQALGAL